ncbi:MAG: aspartate 1-decarboxylase [Candidatus Micrarchaeia archaeon]|jgi:aspartate 1-decarboxylase
MNLFFLKSKIHRARVTDCSTDYEGSITIDSGLLGAAKISEFEMVLVANVSNGSRFETYAIAGKPGSGQVCVNGAAARLCKKGDVVIIMSKCLLNEQEAKVFTPTVVKLDSENRILKK